MEDKGNDGCENDDWFANYQRYALLGKGKDIEGGKYYRLSQKTGDQLSFMEQAARLFQDPKYLWKQIKDIVGQTAANPEDAHWRYALHLVNWIWYDHQTFLNMRPEEQAKENFSEGRYWRFISWRGLYGKDWSDLHSCKKWLDTQNGKTCGDDSAKEYRFCSTVIYSSPYQGIVNICAIMTNFLE